MRRKLALVIGPVVVLAALVAWVGLQPPPRDELSRLRGAFADLKVGTHLSEGPAQGWLFQEHLRFEDVAKRLEAEVGGRPGWIAGKVDRWRDQYTAHYYPQLAYPSWLGWARAWLAPESLRHIYVAVERGYLKQDPLRVTPSGHWMSLTIVSSPITTHRPFTPPFQGWYPNRSSGW